MGLYKLITENYNNFRKDADNFHSLLSHADYILKSSRFNSSIDEPFSFFTTFSEDLGFSKVCILLLENEQYCSFLSYGFHPETFNKSVSTRDFWEGTLETSDWISASGEYAVPFRQLFSDEDNNDINIIHIRKLHLNDTGAIIIITENTKKSIIDFEMVDLVLPSLLPHVEKCIELTKLTSKVQYPSQFDIMVSLENALVENSHGFMFQIDLNNLLNSFQSLAETSRNLLVKCIYDAASIIVKAPDICYMKDSKIKIIRFSNSEMEQDLYAYQLKKSLSPVLTQRKADYLDIEYAGSSTSVQDFSAFLER